MDRKERKAIINGVEYTLDSDNTPLLQLLKEVKRNKETGKMEDVPYLPIEIVYQLLEQMYPNYSLESRPLERERTFTIKKSKRNPKTKSKEDIEEEVVLFRKSVLLDLGDRKIEGSARGVATISQLTIDQMYNGFDMKQEARAIKNACKKLGRVFRIPNDIEEIIEKESITEDLAITEIEKKEEVKKENQPSKLEQDIINAYKQKIGDSLPTKEDLQRYGKQIREEMGLSGDGEKLLKDVYRTLKEFYSLK